jgi:sulfur dioxygenase
MLRVRQLFDAESSTYTYLLCDTGSGAAALVDPVFEQFTRDDALVRELGVDLRFVLDTHVHADHVTAAWLFREARGARIVSSARARAEGVDLPVDDGSRLELGATTLEVRATPGHTDGCLTLVAEGALVAFTGDALLIRGAGRTDFQQGSAAQLFRSIRERIFSLDDDTTLYPAHDYAGRTSTTVAEERAHNPRVGGAANERDFVGYMQNLHLPHPKKIDEAVPANLRSGRPLEPPTGAPSWGPVVRTYAGFPEIEAPWVEAHRGDVLVLDVRDADELESDGRVEGALHIPLSELRARVGEVPRDRPVITLCRSGRRSAQATVLLRGAGLSECANLRGGLLAWRG